ncbi:MAG TPA: IPT/TIG domain-containing protein [Myxococcota bacterium]|jgi:hypothetical protein|nr:IPT/TIG domain-containing protein [Myxococcota bacterium]
MRAHRLLLLIPAAGLLLAGCPKKLDGPTPVLAGLNPSIACNAQIVTTLTIMGSGFSPIVVDTLTDAPHVELPTVTIQRTADLDGNAVSDAPVVIPDDPADPASSLVRWTSQSEMSFDVTPALMLPPGTYSVTVTNPNGHSATLDGGLMIVPPPDLVSVEPPTICTGGGMLTLAGTGFRDGATVDVGGMAASTVDVVSDMQIDATIGGGLDPGVYDVTVTNAEGCSDTLPGAVTIVPGPIVFFVDPPVVYNGVSTQVTIYASGLTGTPTAVSLIENATGTETPLLTFMWDPATPGKILAIVPAGLPAGSYDVVVIDPGGCDAILSAGLTVTDTLTIALESIDPPFGFTAGSTGVEIRATDPAPGGQVQFMPTPRAYLNPAMPGAGTVATALRSVAFVGATLLTAVVPEGLPAGTYDLIVVNPDATVGLLADAFVVAGDAPPVIDTIQPGSVSTQTDATVTIYGDNFRNPAVELTCQDPTGLIATFTPVVTAVDSVSTPETITMTVPSTMIAADSVCVVRVTDDPTNPADGTYVDFSALAVTNPAENLRPWAPGTAMTTARRAPVSFSGRATSVARFLYAAGGDDGTAAGALATVEAAPVDLFGTVGAWFALPYDLPAPRTLAGGVRIGRFLYLVGGNDGAGAVDTLYRAEILHPEDAPVIRDVSVTLGTGVELGGGVWYYRVSALFGPTDPRNPDGESLASDPRVVQLPMLDDRVVLTLLWDPVAGATGYRVYRTPTPDLISGDEELLAEVTGGGATSYTDSGAKTTMAGQVPLPLGATGRWREMGLAVLGSVREGPGVTLGSEPGATNDPDLGGSFYVYAIGGRDGAAPLASYEYLPVTVVSPTEQTVGSWVPGPVDLGSARWQLGAYTLTSSTSSLIPAGDTWVFAGGGLGSGVMAVGDVDAAPVQAGGALGTWIPTDGMSPGRAGYGYAGMNNFLYAFGGLMGAPSTDGDSAKLCASSATPGCTLAPGEPPDLANWNSLGLTMSVDRYLMGSTLESAFIFVVGGDSAGGATATVDFTIW